jgi:phosphoglucomutase
MAHFRETAIERIGDFDVLEKIDRWQGDPQPHLSRTDTSSRNVLILRLQPLPETRSIRVTMRPSGTEPKFKIYIEVLGRPFDPANMETAKASIVTIREKLERAFMGYCYQLLGVDFPERGFLLFWQLPLDDKLNYFAIEDRLAGLKDVADPVERRKKVDALLTFLGANPVQKVDAAFAARFGKGVLDYLGMG